MTRQATHPPAAGNRPWAEPRFEARRFLERGGLLPSDGQVASAVASGPEHQHGRMQFIERARSRGLELHEIRALLAINDAVANDPSTTTFSVVAQIESIEARIVSLMHVRQALLQFRESPAHQETLRRRPILSALLDDPDGVE